jgi:type II secretory pathway component PulM
MSVVNTLRAAWQARPAREQRALKLMGLVLALALLAQSAWMAWQGGERLRQQWPVRAQELARLKLAHDELRQPQMPAAAALAGDALESALRPEAKALAADLSLRRSGPRRFVLEGESDFNALVEWLAQVQQHYGLRVAASEMQRVAERPGRARVTLELAGD